MAPWNSSWKGQPYRQSGSSARASASMAASYSGPSHAQQAGTRHASLLGGSLLVLAAGGQRDVRRADRTLQRPLALVEEGLRPDLARTVRQQRLRTCRGHIVKLFPDRGHRTACQQRDATCSQISSGNLPLVRQQRLPQEDMRPAARLPHRVRLIRTNHSFGSIKVNTGGSQTASAVASSSCCWLSSASSSTTCRKAPRGGRDSSSLTSASSAEHPPPAAPPAPPVLVLLDRRLRPPGPPRIVRVRPSRPVPHTQRRQRQQRAGVREAVRRRARVARLDEEERRQAAGGVESDELGDRGCRTPARERHRLGRRVSADAHADRGRPEGGGEGEAEGEDLPEGREGQGRPSGRAEACVCKGMRARGHRVAVCKCGASPRDEDEARLGLVRKGNLELDPADDHAARRPDRLSAARTEGLPRKPFLDAPLVEAMAAPQRPDGLTVGLAVDERGEADGAHLSLHGFRLCWIGTAALYADRGAGGGQAGRRRVLARGSIHRRRVWAGGRIQQLRIHRRRVLARGGGRVGRIHCRRRTTVAGLVGGVWSTTPVPGFQRGLYS